MTEEQTSFMNVYYEDTMVLNAKRELTWRFPTEKEVWKIVDSALFDVWLEIQGDAIANAPYKSWNLRRSIAVQKIKDGIQVWTNLDYGRMQEFGWTIKPKRSKYLTFKINGRWVRTKKVRIKAQPYLRPALFDKLDKRQSLFLDIVWDDLVKYLKLSKK